MSYMVFCLGYVRPTLLRRIRMQIHVMQNQLPTWCKISPSSLQDSSSPIQSWTTNLYRFPARIIRVGRDYVNSYHREFYRLKLTNVSALANFICSLGERSQSSFDHQMPYRSSARLQSFHSGLSILMSALRVMAWVIDLLRADIWLQAHHEQQRT